jgi:hypothetical protein
MRYAISCVVNFYNAGIANYDQKIGSSDRELQSHCLKMLQHNK